MPTPRRATPADAEEMVRLRRVMLAGMDGEEPAPGPWEPAAVARLRERLHPDPATWAAYVVDDPDRPRRLAACALGVVEERLGGPDNPDGLVGYVFNVATDPRHRRRGHSRACMTALVDWYTRRGVPVVDLRASPDGEPLYRAMGFAPTDHPGLRLRVAVSIEEDDGLSPRPS